MSRLLFLLIFAWIHVIELVSSCPSGCSCESGGKVMCESLGMTALPTDLPPNTKRLEMFDNDMKVLRNGEFLNAGLQGVTELYLDNNNIEVVDKNAFKGLTNLRKILIRYNKIKSVDPDLFKDSKNIKEVYLCGNDLTVTRGIPFLNAFTVEVLKLDSCAVNHIHREMFLNTPNLKHLVIDNNGLESLDAAAFSKLKHVQYLSVAKNRLKTIPLSLIWKLRSLKQVNLAGNEFVCNCQLKSVYNLFMDRNIKPILGTCTTPSNYEGMKWPDVLGRMDCTNGNEPDPSLIEHKTTTTTEPNDHAEVENRPDEPPPEQVRPPSNRPSEQLCVTWQDAGCIGNRRFS